jgi:hypothetical protein
MGDVVAAVPDFNALGCFTVNVGLHVAAIEAVSRKAGCS